MPSTLSHDPNRRPTLLVVHNDAELRSALADSLLRQDGYDVLEAADLPSMVEIVLTQTRPVHLLIGSSADKRIWANRIKHHLPEMMIWFVDRPHPELPSDVLTPEIALATVREFFDRFRGEAAAGQK
jgi:CheY-like chemotaxis protein